MFKSLVDRERATELFKLAGYDVDEAVSIQRSGNKEEIRALLDALETAMTIAKEDDLMELMYIETVIAILLE